MYLDHAATTYVKKEVLDEMIPYFSENFGNPSSGYKLGKSNKAAIELAKKRVADAIGAKENEIYFTAGGSEGDNWAIKGVAFANESKGNHIITTAIEHPAIINSCEFLKKHGFEVTYLSVDEYGLINLEELEKSIRPTTVLISVMFANNEIGTIQPIPEVGEIAKKHNVYFHTDAVQAVGSVKIDVEKMGIDILSMAGHKFYGPKGIGVLYIKDGVNIENLIHGGGQENGKRAGTENVPAVVGIGKAIDIAHRDFEKNTEKILMLRDRLIEGIEKNIPNVRLNGHRKLRLPGNANFSFDGVEAGTLLETLNLHGISVSGGSACSTKSVKPSRVLTAIGNYDNGAIRFSIGSQNTVEDIDYALDVLIDEVEKIRNY